MVFQEGEDEAGAVVGGRAVHDQEDQVDIRNVMVRDFGGEALLTPNLIAQELCP